MRTSHATILFLLLCNTVFGQVYYGISWHSVPVGFWNGHSELHKITVSNGSCTEENLGIVLGALNDSVSVAHFCYCPDNFIYADVWNDSTHLYKIDPQTAQIVGVVPLVGMQVNLNGMVCNGNNIIHAITDNTNSKFVEINPSTGAVSVLATSNEQIFGDLVQYDSVWYAMSYDGFRRLDFDGTTFETELLYQHNPTTYWGGGSVFPSVCNAFIIPYWNANTQSSDLYLTHIDQHTRTLLCPTSAVFWQMVGVEGDYYDPDPSCPVPIDLDRNDNSGALGSDYNSAIFSCKTNHVKIADTDAFIPAYPIIDTMWVSITGGILDPGMERLYLSQPPIGIGATGSNSTTIILTNAAGNARVSDFLDALKLIQYKDIALSPIGGQREITVSFTTRQGYPTDTAKCFVQVQQFPQVPVNLGPDVFTCQGSSVTLDAGNPGLSYYWSGQQTTQTLNAFFQGTYQVTVSDGIRCPGADAVYVKILPNLQALVQGANKSCAGDSLALTFLWNSGAAFDIVVTSSQGQNDTLIGVTTGSTYFLPTPVTNNLNAYTLNYTVTQLLNSNATACLNFSPATHQIQVHPSPILNSPATICEGDSIFLAGAWQKQPGVYTDHFLVPTGCYQTYITTLSVLPSIPTTYVQNTTCNAALAGVFTWTVNGVNGCDSTTVSTITLLSGDTLFVASQTCDPALAGIFTQNITNPGGCDSVIVSTVSLAPSIPVAFDQPSGICQGDTAAITIYILGPGSFDLSMTNINTGQVDLLTGLSSSYTYHTSPMQPALYWPQQIIGPNSTGCLEINNFLSINVLPTSYSQNSFVLCSGDSLFLENAWQTTSGTYTDTLSTLFGCDSIVTSSLLFILPSDTVFVASQTCDPALAGIFTQNLTNFVGCDSTVVTTVTLLPSDTVFVASQTCDPALAGVFTQSLTNQNGCDSTVVTTILLLPSDTVYFASQTCEPALAGIFTQSLMNQNGCDSTVVTTILLLPSDTVFLASQTCEPTSAGVFTQSLTNQNGCDSTVITTVTLQPNDMVFLSSETCDPALVGSSMAFFTNQFGCDSVVVTTVSLLPSDTVFLNLEGCDPAQAGISTVFFTNQYGCDSVVTITYALLASDTTQLTSFTCEPVETGVFEQVLSNGNGCDSLVLLTVVLLPEDSCQTPPTPTEGLLVYAPNAFSPNGDGINDLFQLFTNAEAELILSLQVYSRWGERVFEAYDQQPNDPVLGWDGDFRGKPMDAGVYLFWAEVAGKDGTVQLLKGEVSLLK